MNPETAVDLGRDALLITTIVSAPILIAGLLVGLVVGLIQALTQIQEQTVAFVPKLVAMMLAVAVTLPWMVTRLVSYSADLLRNIPDNL